MNRVSKWLMKRAMMQLSFESSKIIAIIGGLVVLISGVYFFSLSRIAVGLVATVISGQLKHMLWSVIMVVVGVVTYMLSGGGSIWSYGAILVIAGGILSAVTHIL